MTTAKADPTFLVSIGAFCFILGCILISEDGMVPLGVVLLLVSLPCFYLPCIFTTYEINFEIANNHDTGLARVMRRLSVFWNHTSRSIVLRKYTILDYTRLYK
jgi:hypothetical protein